MKKLILHLPLFFIFILLSNQYALPANELFKSIASGNWNSNSTWQMSTDGGGTWFAATKSPNDSAGAITIQSPNTVTVTISVNVNQLAVNSGGTISINASVILTITDGSGEDLTLANGATISGSGILQTQGAGMIMNIRYGSSFNASLKINTGITTVYNSDYPNPAEFYGSVTVDAGATLTVSSGGYYARVNNTLTNNGIINGSSSYFLMKGPSLVNNDTIRVSNFQFDTATTLSGTGVNTSSYITVGSSGNLTLANNITFSPLNTITVNGGAVINPNAKILTFTSGIFQLNSGATVSNSGTFRTQNAVSLNIRSGSNFNVPLNVNTGTTTTYDEGGPYNAILKGDITVDAGANLHVRDGGYYTTAYKTVTVNGSITGNSVTFYLRGSSLINNGSITSTGFEFDTTTSVTGTGSYSSNTITIAGSGDVTLMSNIIFSPLSSFSINSGGKFNPGSKMFTFTSGTFTLFSGAIVSGTGANAGTMQTQGNVYFNFRNGSTFNSAIKVNSGTLTAYNSDAPYVAVFSGTITVDAGATLKAFDGGYTIQANNSFTNNGSVTGSSSSLIMRGSSFINSNSISITNLNFDSTVALSGAGTYTCSIITIGSSGNVTLINNLTFSPLSNFAINNGGILNPNLKIFTLNSGNLTLNPGATISGSGTFQTQGTVTMNVRNGSFFNAPLKVNSGTTTSYDNAAPYIAKFNGAMNIDAGAILNVYGGGYFIQANNTLTNNGTISGPASGFIVRGPSFINNGILNSTNLYFDTTTTVSGNGSFSPANIVISASGNVSLGSNVSFTITSLFNINGGGIINPNTFTFSLSAYTLNMYNGSTTVNSGIFKTVGNIILNIKNGSAFNAPLKVHSGIAQALDDASPYTAVFNGTVTVDTGATLTAYGGGYSIRLNNNVTNYGTITSGGGSTVNFYGTTITNNGLINPSILNFQPGVHTLQGTGSSGTNLTVISGSTVTLASNHQLLSVTVNSGGTFDLSTFKLSLTASNPISNSGTFNTAAGTIEYNGTSSQSISTGITYNRLRINNSSGTSLPGAVTVNDTLSVILGDLNLNGQILTIAPSGYLTETLGNTVTGSSGYITTTRNLNAPSALNVGGLGAVLTTSVNLGSTEIRRGHTVQSGLGGNTSILRYFDITPTTNSGLNATLVFKYDESELNGKIESALSLYKSTNSGTNWTGQGGTVNTTLNTITLNAIGSFSRWSASSAAAVASQIKLLLEGFYNTGTGRMNMRDTVRVYLRNSTSPFALVDSALSVIDSVSFTGNFLFANAPTGTYYIQVKHRNALETWSRTGGEAYILGSALNYDFTTDSAKAYGKNMKKSGTKWVFYEGDVNQEGFVDLTDELLIYNDANSFLSGYVKTDVNGDRIADLTDLLTAYNNAVIFVAKSTP